MAVNWRERVRGVRAWAHDRFGLGPLRQAMLERRVARTPWYYGDGATLMLLLGVLVATGMVMTLSYSPSLDGAYDSVAYLSDRQAMGWLVRALHYWSAGMMVVMVTFHLLRQILVAGYKFPREGTWLIGLLLMLGVLANAWSGYVLRWDQTGAYSLKVALNVLHTVPLLGDGLVRFVQGGAQMTSLALTRVYGLHVVWVPLLLIGMSGYHLYLVVLHGVTSRRERRQAVHTVEAQRRLYHEQAESPTEGEPFYPDTAVKSGAMALTVFAVVLGLALTRRAPPLGDRADLAVPAHPAEEWWFAWYSSLIALLPPTLANWAKWLIPLGVFAVLVLLPFVDRGPYRGIRRRPLAAGIVALTALALVALTAQRRLSPWTGGPQPGPPQVPAGRVLTAGAEEGRQLFARHGCTSCHAVAGVGPTIATDMARLPKTYSPQELRRIILTPPATIAMPAYEGRLSETELRRLIEFIMAAHTFPRTP